MRVPLRAGWPVYSRNKVRIINDRCFIRTAGEHSKKISSLAPMEGVTDFPMRIWMWLCSAPTEMSTPFLRLTSSWPQSLPLSWAPELLVPGLSGALPYRLWPQLMATDAGRFVQIAAQLATVSQTVEINCGCPAPTVVGKGAGSGLLVDPKRFEQYVGTIARELDQETLSIKMRTGYDSISYFPDYLEALARLRLARVVIHGRTRAYRYQGLADWNLIAKASKQLPCPVTGSGDITSHSVLKQKHEIAPLVAGGMVGRGALRNPWIFSELSSSNRVRIPLPALIAALKVHVCLHELFLRDPRDLYELCLKGIFSLPAGTCQDRWHSLLGALASKLGYSGPEIIASAKSLGRLKLIWNYLRSSLPEAWFSPYVLRSRSVDAFFGALEGLSGPDKLRMSCELAWNCRYDWLYSGGQKPGPS